MSVVLFTPVIAMAEALLLVIIFALLCIQNHETYLRYWTAAWIITFIGLSCLLGITVNPLFFIFYMSCLSIANYFFLRASYQIFGLIMPQIWKYCTLFIIAWLITSALLGLPDPFRTIPWSIFAGIAVIYNGIIFLRFGGRNIRGRNFVGFCYILWGIHALDFPYLRTISWVAPWGFLIGTILALSVAISMLYYYFEKKNKELVQMEEELKYMSFHDALTGFFLVLKIYIVKKLFDGFNKNHVVNFAAGDSHAREGSVDRTG